MQPVSVYKAMTPTSVTHPAYSHRSALRTALRTRYYVVSVGCWSAAEGAILGFYRRGVKENLLKFVHKVPLSFPQWVSFPQSEKRSIVLNKELIK
jgi:hypothetical protein